MILALFVEELQVSEYIYGQHLIVSCSALATFEVCWPRIACGCDNFQQQGRVWSSAFSQSVTG